jgi:hypothetical protein
MASSSILNGSDVTAMFDVRVDKEIPPQLHVYERFRQRIFERLDYRKRDAAISLHKLFRFVEKTVRLLGKF